MIKLSYLASLGSLADKSFVNSGECRSIVVDVQKTNVDGDMAALTRIIWRTNRKEFMLRTT